MHTPDPQQLRYQQLAELWTAAQPTVAAYIRSMIRDYHAAEDLLQKTAAALVIKFDQYDPTRSFTRYAIGVAHYEVLNHLRHAAADPHTFVTDTLDAVTDAYESLADALPDRRQALAECLEQTPTRSRELLELRYAESLSPTDIAQRMNTTANAARVALHRIHAALRDCIEDHLNPAEAPAPGISGNPEIPALRDDKR